jgi:hypothetical protein
MTDDEFNAVKMAVGEVHWGYIPDQKKPSSKRAVDTHKRLCRHYNFASQAKECCAFPDLIVVDGDVEKGPIKKVAPSLCSGFDGWAKRAKLYDIPDDSGWFDKDSAMA